MEQNEKNEGHQEEEKTLESILQDEKEPYPAPKVEHYFELLDKTLLVYNKPKKHNTCYGRGIRGYNPKRDHDKETMDINDVIMCGCVGPNIKQADEIRNWATRHPSEWKKFAIPLTSYETYIVKK